MTILPMYPSSGEKGVVMYASGDVHTTIDGERVFVSSGYVATDRIRIISDAFGNAQVRQWRSQLAKKLQWSSRA